MAGEKKEKKFNIDVEVEKVPDNALFLSQQTASFDGGYVLSSVTDGSTVFVFEGKGKYKISLEALAVGLEKVLKEQGVLVGENQA